tara:strand:+ start:2973 stop:5075 length:2103 start_codon:yes stop_codon:yes gene_type:complete
MKLLAKKKGNLTREKIADALDLHSAQDQEALRRRLRAMERDGQLMFNKYKGYSLMDESLMVSGKISIHQDGFGFVSYSDTEKDLFLTAGEISHVFDGDTVQVLMSPQGSGNRSFNKLIKILERNTTQIVGILKRKGDDFYLVPDSSKISHKVDVDDRKLMDAQAGQLVNTDIVEYPTFRQNTLVKIAEVLGHPEDPGMEITVALHRHGLLEGWTDEEFDHAEAFGSEVAEEDKVGRVDYRDLSFMTIDGADARDFDDAVYCERKKSGEWRLMVAIADVSHYVRPDDVLDVEAQTRATSIYFPGHVVPMLPETLSNGLCSLNPDVDRLAIVCDMTINAKGIVISSEFSEGVIHSHARLTYDQANAVAVKRQSKMARDVANTNPDIIEHIKNLHELYNVLIPARSKRGAIDFDTQELKFNLNKNKKIASMSPVIRNDAHKMIEEFMLCANVATANFLDEHKIPSLFRSHDGPTDKKLTALREFLSEKGLVLAGGDKPTSQHYNQLMNKIDGRGDASIIRTMLLRSQSQADYSPKNDGHFGLAYDAYAHFTSPIRRYPDLLAHRAIRKKLADKKKSTLQRLKSLVGNRGAGNKVYPYNKKDMKELGIHCSNQSRLADEVSREVENWLKCQYMQKFSGDSFSATVSGVANFGLFVELDQMGVEGLVHSTNLKDPNKEYALGDKLEVILNKVDMKQRKIDLLIKE